MGSYDPGNPYKDKVGNGSPYDYLRNKATQEAGNSQAQAQDAITRRAAAMGNLNSGSYIKAQEELGRQAQDQAQNARGQIDVAEVQGALPYRQMEQQQSQFEKQLGQQESQFSREMPLKQRQLDLEERQQNLDAHANDLNYQLGQYQSQHSGGLFGGGGALGLGLGNTSDTAKTWALAGTDKIFGF